LLLPGKAGRDLDRACDRRTLSAYRAGARIIQIFKSEDVDRPPSVRLIRHHANAQACRFHAIMIPLQQTNAGFESRIRRAPQNQPVAIQIKSYYESSLQAHHIGGA
jgi:hypothetical protein